MSFDKKISELFGIDQLPVDQSKLPAVVPEAPVSSTNTDDATVDGDYNYARKNIRELIERGMIDLEDIASIAKQSESPRAYEVMSTILKTVIDANKDLLTLAKAKKEIKQLPSGTGTPPGTVNNNLIVAPTSKINRLLEQLEQDEGLIIRNESDD
jgi:hypothetical protein